jgi:hypothetical protein
MNNHRKIQVQKVRESNRAAKTKVVRPKRTIQVIHKESSSVKKNVIMVRNKGEQQARPVRFQRNIEAVRNKGQRQIIRNKTKIVKDANFHKISDLRNCGLNRILVMIACGPSVSDIDFTPLIGDSNVDIMVINKPFKQVWPSKYWAFCDQSQYERNKDAFNKYNGTLINSSAVRATRPNQIRVTAKHGTGVSRNLTEGYVIGRSSVYANLQAAIWMNFNKIFVFGVDMCKVGDKLHHYGTNPDVPPSKRLERFKTEAQNYEIMAKALSDEIRSKIYFCSSHNPWKFVDKFNKWNHEDAVERIISISKSISETCKDSKEPPAT